MKKVKAAGDVQVVVLEEVVIEVEIDLLLDVVLVVAKAQATVVGIEALVDPLVKVAADTLVGPLVGVMADLLVGPTKKVAADLPTRKVVVDLLVVARTRAVALDAESVLPKAKRSNKSAGQYSNKRISIL